MFFYLHCGRGFSCLYGGRTNRCLIRWSLCDNPGNTYGQHKAPRHTSHIWISHFASRAPLTHTRHWRFIWLRAGQCLLWLVSNLPMLVEAWAGFPTGIDSTRARFAHDTSPRCSFNKTSAQLTRQTAKSLLKRVELLQNVWWYDA